MSCQRSEPELSPGLAAESSRDRVHVSVASLTLDTMCGSDQGTPPAQGNAFLNGGSHGEMWFWHQFPS